MEALVEKIKNYDNCLLELKFENEQKLCHFHQKYKKFYIFY